jgi:phosphoglucosamine mutase
MDFSGTRIVVDCANGATYSIAPSVFAELGATVIPISVSPNGLNINLDCGSTKPAALQAAVKAHEADLGVAFDGDGDRVIMVDHRGEVVDGDELLFIIAQDRLRSGSLSGAVVGTLMTNLGLEAALNSLGIALIRTKVGDRYIMECLHAQGLTLGGEGSGHLICLDRTTTGDGIVSALQVMTAMAQSGRSLQELKSGMHKYPQLMVNVPMDCKFDLTSCAPVQEAIRDAEDQLGNKGRVLLRPSGTEPLVRVMVEGQDVEKVSILAKELAAVVKNAISTGVHA